MEASWRALYEELALHGTMSDNSGKRSESVNEVIRNSDNSKKSAVVDGNSNESTHENLRDTGDERVAAALKLLKTGTDNAAVAAFLVLAKHVSRDSFMVHRRIIAEAVRTSKTLLRMLATDSQDGGFQKLAITILGAFVAQPPPQDDSGVGPKCTIPVSMLSQDIAEAQEATSYAGSEQSTMMRQVRYTDAPFYAEDVLQLLGLLNHIIATRLLEADNIFAEEMLDALRWLMEINAANFDSAESSASCIDVLIEESCKIENNCQRRCRAIDILCILHTQLEVNHAIKLAGAWNTIANEQASSDGQLFLDLGRLNLAFILGWDRDLFLTDFNVKEEGSAYALARSLSNAIFSSLKRSSRMASEERCVIFTLVAALFDEMGPVWPQMTSVELGSASPVSFLLQMLAVELEICLTDARYGWIEGTSSNAQQLDQDNPKHHPELANTSVACLRILRWTVRYFTERVPSKVARVQEKYQWTSLDGESLLSCRQSLEACIRSITQFVCLVRKASTSSLADFLKPSLLNVLRFSTDALGEYLQDGCSEIMGNIEEAELEIKASSGGFDTLLYLLTVAGPREPGLATVNILLSADECKIADALLQNHRNTLGPALVNSIAGLALELTSDDIAPFQGGIAAEAEATILDATELFYELGGEDAAWLDGTKSVKASLEGWQARFDREKGSTELDNPSLVYFKLQVLGCLLYLDICQNRWDAARHKNIIERTIGQASLLQANHQDSLNSFIFPRLQKLSLQCT